MTDRDRLIETTLRDPYSIGGRGSNLEHKLARALQDCERERDDYKHAAGAEAQLADLNMERAKEAEQRVRNLEVALGEAANLFEIVGQWFIDSGPAVPKSLENAVLAVEKRLIALFPAASPTPEEPRNYNTEAEAEDD